MVRPTSPAASSFPPNTAVPEPGICHTGPTFLSNTPANASTDPTAFTVYKDKERWQPPKSALGRKLYATLCLIALGNSSMERIGEHLNETDKKLWEKGVRQMYERLNNIILVAGLLLATSAVFITTMPPEESIVNYIRRGPYLCIIGSFGLLIGGIIVGSAVLLVLARLQPESVLNVFCADRFRVYCMLIILSYPVISVSVATLLLAFGLLSAVWTSEDVSIKGAAVIILVLPCTMAVVFAAVCCSESRQTNKENNVTPPV